MGCSQKNGTGHILPKLGELRESIYCLHVVSVLINASRSGMSVGHTSFAIIPPRLWEMIIIGQLWVFANKQICYVSNFSQKQNIVTATDRSSAKHTSLPVSSVNSRNSLSPLSKTLFQEKLSSGFILCSKEQTAISGEEVGGMLLSHIPPSPFCHLSNGIPIPGTRTTLQRASNQLGAFNSSPFFLLGAPYCILALQEK